MSKQQAPTTGYVIDASVFVADALPNDIAHTEAAALLERMAINQWPMHIPTILLAEVAASIARQTDDAITALQYIQTWQKLPNFRIEPVDVLLGNVAAEIGAQQRIRGCDAMYVALAQQMNATLITLDKEQRQRVPPSMIAHTPAEELAQLQP